jgi:UDP-glucose 4-epimerase
LNVLVTGGAGYIGSVAVERLTDVGHDVVVLDNLWRGHAAAVPKDVEFVQCDLRDQGATLTALAKVKPDAVLHIAAATLVPESVEQPGLYFGTNVVGTHNLLTAMIEQGVRKLVFSSTAAVYGMPASLPITEDATTTPINPYGLSKLMVEQMLEWHAAADGLRYAALRYFNVAGATDEHGEDHRPETHLIPVALQSLLGKCETLHVFGTDYPTSDGTAIRDYVHVVDLVDAHLLALDMMDNESRSLGAFNIGTKDGFSVKEIIDVVERVTGRTLTVEYAPRRAGDPPSLIANSARARTTLGWKPVRSSLEEMITSAWNWRQRYPAGYPSSGG